MYCTHCHSFTYQEIYEDYAYCTACYNYTGENK